VGLARDVLQPYKTEGEIWSRRIINETASRAAVGAPVFVLNAPADIKPTTLWYLLRHADCFRVTPAFDPAELAPVCKEVWCLHFDWQPPRSMNAVPPADPNPGAWSLESYRDFSVRPDRPGKPVEHCKVYHWVRRSDAHANSPSSPEHGHG
jgi:hypothetical protein